MGKDTWEVYYRQAYERAKQENQELAGRLADLERREEELGAKYAGIVGNPLYRLTGPFRLAGRAAKHAAHRLSGTGGAGPRPDSRPLPKTDAAVSDYCLAEAMQKFPYRQWIAKVEVKQRQQWPRRADFGGFVILCCEAGMPETGALAWVCARMREQKLRLAYTHEDFCLPVRPAGTKATAAASEERLVRFAPWMKPAWQPDTFLSFFSMGSLVLAETSFCLETAERMRRELLSGPEEVPSGEKLPAGEKLSADAILPVYRVSRQWLYDFCLHAQETLAQAEEEPCLLDVVGFHRYFDAQAQEGTGGKNAAERAVGKETAPEESAGDLPLLEKTEEAEGAEECLQKELAEGKHIWGYTQEYAAIKEAAVRRRGLRGEFNRTKDPDVWAFVPAAQKEDGSAPLVSIVIPSKDHPEVLERCVRSIREKTAYDSYEILVVDNGSGPEAMPELERMTEQYSLRCYREERPFNFSAMCNLGAKKARGELLLLLNNDIEILEENWLTILAGQAWQAYAGAVGAKLYYPQGERLQHDGITNMGIGPSHKLATFSDDCWYYFGQNRFTQDCIGVTGACLCVRKSVWEELGGLDETMPVAYNDVDFCFRLFEAGYTNILRNDAVLTHHESLTRGLDEQTAEKWDRLLLEKERLYALHSREGQEGRREALQPACGRRGRPVREPVDAAGKDPYYSRHLVQDAPEYVIAPAGEAKVSLCTVRPQPLRLSEKKLKKCSCPKLRVTVDRSLLRLKIHRSEPDIYLIDGWSYVQGADNCRYDRWLTLLSDSGLADSACCPAAPADQGELPGPALQVPLTGKYRPDAAAILPEEVHIGLAGFEVRLLAEDLPVGVYRIGLLCEDRGSGQLLYQETAAVLRVERSTGTHSEMEKK